MPINEPGQWDFFLSRTQNDGEGKTITSEVFYEMKDRDRPCWLDGKMVKCDNVAMKKGVCNSRCLIAIVTDNGVDSYFSRPMCREEVKWALEAGIPIAPVVADVDKPRVGEFITEGTSHGLDFGSYNFVHVDHYRPRYLTASCGLDMEPEPELENVRKCLQIDTEFSSKRNIDMKATGDAQRGRRRAEAFSFKKKMDVRWPKDLPLCTRGQLS